MKTNCEENKSVLIVDDVDVNRLFAFHALKKRYHAIDFAENGAEAVKKIRSGRYDLVLMDIAMPVMDGITATKLVRADESITHQPFIICVSAYQHYTHDCLKAGMDALIFKPYSMKALMHEIEKIETEKLALQFSNN